MQLDRDMASVLQRAHMVRLAFVEVMRRHASVLGAAQTARSVTWRD